MAFIKKHGVWLAPVLIFVVLTLLLYMYSVKSELKLPAAGWSRTVHVPVQSSHGVPYNYEDDHGLHLYTFVGGKIISSQLSDTLQLKSQQKYDVNGDVMRIMWAHGDDIVFKKDFNLYYKDGTKTSLIDKKVGDGVYNDGNIFYFKGSSLKSTNLKTLKTTQIKKFSNGIEDIAIDNHYGALLLVTQNAQTLETNFFLQATDNPNVHFKKIVTVVQNGGIANTKYSVQNNQFSLFFTVVPKGSKGSSDLPYYISAPIKKVLTGPTLKPDLNSLMFFSNEAANSFTEPDYFSFSNKGGQPTILFSANGYRALRSDSMNVYEAHPNDHGSWTAERRSTTKDASFYPFWLGSKTIAWFDFDQFDHFKIGVSSQNPQVIADSLKLRSEDLSNASSDTALALPRSLIFFLFIMMFSFLALMVYMIIIFTKVELIERESQVAKWVLIGAFMIGQYIWSAIAVTPRFDYYAPSYLTFPFSAFVVPTIIGIIAWLLTRLIAKDWGIVSEVMYFALLFTVAFMFSFGPYYF